MKRRYLSGLLVMYVIYQLPPSVFLSNYHVATPSHLLYRKMHMILRSLRELWEYVPRRVSSLGIQLSEYLGLS